MDPRQISCLLVLKSLGIDPSIDSFNKRLIVQKSIYLSQALGLKLGYHYRWYLRGPYCSALAQDLYSAIEDPEGMDDINSRWSLDAKSKQRLGGLGKILCCDPSTQSGQDPVKMQARHVELLASVHFLIDRQRVAKSDVSAMTKTLKAFGKNFDGQEVKKAINQLKTAQLLKG